MHVPVPVPTGAGGAKALPSRTLHVPSEFPTIADALAFIDGQPVNYGASFVIKLAATPNSFHQESVEFIERAHHNVRIEGADPIRATSTAVSVTGSMPDWVVTLTFADSVFPAAAALAKFVTLQAVADPGNAADGSLSGTWQVTSTTATTVTLKVQLWGFTSMSSNPPTGQFNAIVFPTRMRSTYRPNWTKKALFSGVNSVLPVLKNLLLDGDRYYDGTDPDHIGIRAIGSTVRIASDHADLPGLAIVRTHRGVECARGSDFTGRISVGDCASHGIICFQASRLSTDLLIANGNFGNGCVAAQSSLVSISATATDPPSRMCGNYVSGLSVGEGCYVIAASGAIINNYNSAQVQTWNNGLTILGASAEMLLGTITPTANTGGNFNSYNRRY